mgnify:CR=1 FL=1
MRTFVISDFHGKKDLFTFFKTLYIMHIEVNGVTNGDDFVTGEQKQKRKFGFIIIFVIFAIILNLFILPISYFIGVMATGAPGAGIYDFIFGFLLVQTIPIILLLISIFLMINSIKKFRK